MSTARTRIHHSSRPLDLGAVVGVLRRGAGDPTSRREEPGTWWFAWRAPTGPVTLRLAQAGRSARIEASAWGAGADWMLDRLPALLGEEDDARGFQPRHAILEQLWRRFAGWRVPASGLVTQSLLATIIEQRVTGREAFAGYRRLVRRFGDPAPGPGEQRRLVVPPSPADWAAVPSWEWLRAGVDGARSATAVSAAGRAGRLEECVAMPPGPARRRLEALPGVGRWSSAEVAHRALGDADAVSFGDHHVAKDVTWALTGTVGDDAALAEVLAPYAGHRYRVQRLLELGGVHRPRRGPRRSLPTHLPAPGGP